MSVVSSDAHASNDAHVSNEAHVQSDAAVQNDAYVRDNAHALFQPPDLFLYEVQKFPMKYRTFYMNILFSMWI